MSKVHSSCLTYFHIQPPLLPSVASINFICYREQITQYFLYKRAYLAIMDCTNMGAKVKSHVPCFSHFCLWPHLLLKCGPLSEKGSPYLLYREKWGAPKLDIITEQCTFLYFCCCK
ncbi:Hypothetical predicted protein [Podarcis lilfordi]|uniref:Uncharacterized protein n=1 Tax=Podarcis lilfordi TaxID=74358 RepID=A0AA35JVX3_9SAUR|nr:Hypothetical predicted protein [Podarcis lilfordi]